jgi:signal transduction histidine kinase
VHLRFTSNVVEVEVVDDGLGAALGASSAAGHGIVGMRERVALYGGSLVAAAGPDGFRVSAVLPLDGR